MRQLIDDQRFQTNLLIKLDNTVDSLLTDTSVRLSLPFFTPFI